MAKRAFFMLLVASIWFAVGFAPWLVLAVLLGGLCYV